MANKNIREICAGKSVRHKGKLNRVMPKPKFSIARQDAELSELIEKTDHKTLAVWAIDCARRILHFFEEKYPNDTRPSDALRTLREWINTGVFRMETIRRASLAAHAAARETGEDDAARSAARAAGHTVATAHVRTHAVGAAIYAQQAIHRAASETEAESSVERERNWQYQHLIKLRENLNELKG